MKKMILALMIGLMTSVMAFAEEEENAALGFGIMSDSKDQALVGGGIRGNLFLDFGYKLAGPFYYGFEFQGDVKRISQNSSYFSTTEVTAFFFNNAQVIILESNNYKQTYTLWDLDFSPRGYLSFDLGNKIQLLGFAGLNYNWQTLDYELKNTTNGGDLSAVGKSGDTYKESTSFDGVWSLLMGFRVTVGAFYVDYTRFLQANDTGDYAWNQYNKDRLGAGINLRF